MSDHPSPSEGPADKPTEGPPTGGPFTVLLNGVLNGLNTIGSIWIFALTALINADSLGRTFFTAPIDGVNEMIELSLVGIVFLQLGDATRHGRLTKTEGASILLRRVSPIADEYRAAIFDFLGMVFMAIILYGSFPLLIESIENDYYVGNEGVFTAPVWPIKLVILIGCAVTFLQFFVFARRHLWNVGRLKAGAAK